MKKVKRREVQFKPSRAILAFAQPMLADVTDVARHDLTRKVLKVATAIWNATTLDERGEPNAMDDIHEIIAGMPDHLQKIARAMIEERRADFSRNDYLLRDVDLVEDEDGKMHVTAVGDAR